MDGYMSFAYLQTYTKEQDCFIAGPDSGILAEHTFMIEKHYLVIFPWVETTFRKLHTYKEIWDSSLALLQ
jgi:hypothetical protein